MKNYIIYTFLFFVLIFSLNFYPASAAENLNVYFFWGDGCPHCEKERNVLDLLEENYPNIKIYDFEIYKHNENISLLQKISTDLGVAIDGVPLTIIGDKQFTGFSEYLTPNELKNRIEQCLNQNCPDNTGKIIGIVEEGANINIETKGDNNVTKEIRLPFLGLIKIENFSLPLLTIIMGGLDGFNPCAMWTLLFLISLLLGMENKKRMWFFGIAFIIASASVYFLFMAAWLNLILFLGFIAWVRVVIGIFALAGGSYNIKEFFKNTKGGCCVTGDEKRQKIFNKLKLITHAHSFWMGLLGIIILAFAVNLVELICSAGLPAIYTQVLALSDLNSWQYYLYIGLYIFVFMMDDLFVFLMAMITLQMTGITTKYARTSKLVGGILMLAIGSLLIFKPEILMFG